MEGILLFIGGLGGGGGGHGGGHYDGGMRAMDTKSYGLTEDMWGLWRRVVEIITINNR